MLSKSSARTQLHLSVILFGFTAILGKVIILSALVLVWWRVFLACISMVFEIRRRKLSFNIDQRSRNIFWGIGIIIALHWICFYGAVKLSNSSITLLCMATTSFFTSLIEPAIFRKRIEPVDIIIGLIIIPVMAFIAKDISGEYYLGAIVGLLSALLASIFSVLNKKNIDRTSPMVMSFWQLTGVLGFITVILPFYFYQNPDALFFPPDALNWLYMIILAILCTTIAWVLTLQALKHVSAFESTLVINLEPVYGIVLAAVLLQEYKQVGPGFYIGSTIIMILVILYPQLKRKWSKSSPIPQ